MTSATLDSPEVLDGPSTVKVARKRPVRDRHTTDFIKLTEEVRATGLMARDVTWYVTRFIRQGIGYLMVLSRCRTPPGLRLG